MADHRLIQVEKKFQVFVGIDFGTDGTGLAYALPTGEVFVHQKWKGYKRSVEVKPKTRILLDENGKFLAFGQPATNSYIAMDGAKNGFMLFERFKMALYDNGVIEHEDQKNVDLCDTVTALNGKELSSDKVFIEALKYIKEQVFKFFSKNKLQIDNIDDIQWILTVPAIWSEKAKYKMEQWAQKAELINKLIPNHLKIVYEPDCASLSIQYEIQRRKTEKNKKMSILNDHQLNQDNEGIEENTEEHWCPGERYILIDAGGGTCDVASHEILQDFAVKEVAHPSGGPWGSTYIDDHFVTLLYKIFSKEWIELFKTEDPSAYTELIDNFRVAKRGFWRDDDDMDIHKDNADKWHNIELPFDFCAFLEGKVDNGDIETLVQGTQIDNKAGVIALEEEYLKLSYVVWTTQLFDIVIEPILNHCKHLLDETVMKSNTRYLCLVGGLGSSKYLQSRIKSEFGVSSTYGLEIIIPERPILSVVDGAARFGLRPDYIQARTLSKTYGNAIDPKIESVDIDTLPPGFLETNQYPCGDVVRIRNVFSVFARKNQTIHIGEPIIKKFKRFDTKQQKVRVSVYGSDDEDPKVVTTKPLATTTVVFPPNSQELTVIVELYFSDTKIRVFAYPEDIPQNKKEMELEY